MDSARREEIRRRLKAEAESARLAYVQQSEIWDAALKEVAAHLPHPDGTLQIKKLGLDYRNAFATYACAVQLLNDFVLTGVEPPDDRFQTETLPKKPPTPHTP